MATYLNHLAILLKQSDLLPECCTLSKSNAGSNPLQRFQMELGRCICDKGAPFLNGFKHLMHSAAVWHMGCLLWATTLMAEIEPCKFEQTLKQLQRIYAIVMTCDKGEKFSSPPEFVDLLPPWGCITASFIIIDYKWQTKKHISSLQFISASADSLITNHI